MANKNDLSRFANLTPTTVLQKTKTSPKGGVTASGDEVVQTKVKKHKAPWDREGIEKEPRVKVPISFSAKEYAMLKFLKEKEGTTIAFSLTNAAMPIIEKRAKKALTGSD